ncbi:uncharacterized protein yc1106_04211 [Curvularia clavata]|uniref:Uncharacterized protein n=1 Tax=Curvularia clavata TaxID=95742 RepID=A0A9Q8Z7A4_CURCL|nr:uncharacterized protein yc1106_04211 [Curvularia clavata]
MDAHQFGDLSQMQATEEQRFPLWMTAQDNYMYSYKPHVVQFPLEEETYFDDLDNGSISVPPMQRFMNDSYPFSHGMLQANIPLNSQYRGPMEQQWSPEDCFRQPSPDRSSSSNTSQNTQDELRSPYVFHASMYTSPMEYSQSLFSCSSTEQFQSGPFQFDTPPFGSNCTTLREIEYNPVSEVVAEEPEDVIVKKEVVSSHEHGAIHTSEAPEYSTYADSAIGHSTRVAQSVEPVEFVEDPSSDSEYSPPSYRSGKRRRSTASSSGSSRTSKRRGHTRKDSHTASPTTSTKPEKKSRRGSRASHSSVEQADHRRPFPCPLAAYGCKSDFSSKNEWKRHVSTQHIKLAYWRCDLCPESVDPNDNNAEYHNDFNRKDLFTQHLRRMHAIPKDKSSHSAKEFPVTESNLPEHQARCNRWLRDPPQHSSCLFCHRTFEGENSWEERIEHVGRHLEKDHESRAEMLDVTTWILDERLEQYLVEEGLVARDGSGWKIGDGNPCRESEE